MVALRDCAMFLLLGCVSVISSNWKNVEEQKQQQHQQQSDD
jgi:outer membrane biogenesis lipoprotein LolB